MKPTRVFLSVQPIRPVSRQHAPLRYRASWWTRKTTTEPYRSKPVSSEAEAVRLALRWLDRRNQEADRSPELRLIDTTEQPERFGYVPGTTLTGNAS